MAPSGCWNHSRLQRARGCSDMWRFPEIGVYPQIIHVDRIFHCKPFIWGTPIFGNTHFFHRPKISPGFLLTMTMPTMVVISSQSHRGWSAGCLQKPLHGLPWLPCLRMSSESGGWLEATINTGDFVVYPGWPSGRFHRNLRKQWRHSMDPSAREKKWWRRSRRSIWRHGGPRNLKISQTISPLFLFSPRKANIWKEQHSLKHLYHGPSEVIAKPGCFHELRGPCKSI